jgi:hypothetical protein
MLIKAYRMNTKHSFFMALLVGGLLANTDACRQSKNCGLVLTNTSILSNNIAKDGGSGLFVTNINSSIVKLGNCSAGSAPQHHQELPTKEKRTHSWCCTQQQKTVASHGCT